MSEVTSFKVRIVTEGNMPEQWLRSYLDDMFGDEDLAYIIDGGTIDTETILWVCRDCGMSYNGAANPMMTDCDECGGGMMIMAKPEETGMGTLTSTDDLKSSSE